MKFFGVDVWKGKEIVFPSDPNVVWGDILMQAKERPKN